MQQLFHQFSRLPIEQGPLHPPERERYAVAQADQEDLSGNILPGFHDEDTLKATRFRLEGDIHDR